MSSKHDNLWDLLVKYNFEVTGKNYRDLICVICKRLLINAHQSCCGCRYCYKCIEKYLEDKKKLCPGKGEGCNEQLISLFDIQVDHVANVKISKATVKCPDTICQFKDELRKMESHIKSHQIKCPYFEIGCSKVDINNADINNHLNIEHGNHANLLIDSIQNMRNDIATLREESLKKDEVLSLTQKLLEDMKIAHNRNEEVIETLKREINGNQIVAKNLKSEVANLNNELKNFKKTYKKENQIKSMNESQKSMNGNKGSPKTKVTINSPKPILELTNVINGVKYSPFIWKIENFSDKKNTAKNVCDSFILSDTFYSHVNGYKICLTIFPDGSNVSQNDWLSVGFHLMKSEHDKDLFWPMAMNITIGLVNQKTNQIHASETYNVNSVTDINRDRFFRPVFGMNGAVVAHKFVKFTAITSNANLCKNDSIVIKCVVKNIEATNNPPH